MIYLWRNSCYTEIKQSKGSFIANKNQRKGHEMKVTIEVDEDIAEESVVIKCKKLDERILRIQQALNEQASHDLTILLHKNEKEFYMPLEAILFFETENKEIRAHTRNDIYDTQYKLYELEEILPGYFMRIAKSTIVNVNHIYSITKNITASSIVEFSDCHKQVYVSRNYYKALVERLAEKRRRI